MESFIPKYGKLPAQALLSVHSNGVWEFPCWRDFHLSIPVVLVFHVFSCRKSRLHNSRSRSRELIRSYLGIPKTKKSYRNDRGLNPQLWVWVKWHEIDALTNSATTAQLMIDWHINPLSHHGSLFIIFLLELLLDSMFELSWFERSSIGPSEVDHLSI